ncbi:hypothetical protein Taro_025517 [Colocasia esculenta]|uniref:Dof zinc finger protein n=1 Tax=Colocasia esculenta TaxID=4460 RepID=A0A843VHU4_COLES|nr:hypothetical protein [Colocasia esculenta]
MVFSSVPVYLDPPNWNQQQTAHPLAQATGGDRGGGADAHQLPPSAPPRNDGNAGGSARPGSMAERARLAKVPQPEPGLKCPRCESANTKFCYFNNYSLSQPRHFCKTCRRYWTRGGALRNVPVGGGCRRNKRSKSSGGGSKSEAGTAAADHRQVGTSASNATSGAVIGTFSSNIPAPLQLPFMASLHSLPDYAAAASIRLNLGGMQPLDTVDFQVGACPSVGLEHWRLPQVQQFPFMAGLESAPAAPQSVGLFPFDGAEGGAVDGVLGGLAGQQVHGKPSASGLIAQMSSVKMEENPQKLTLPKQYLGIPGNDQYWVGGGSTGGGSSSAGEWTDLSGFNPSSASNIL